MAVDRAAAPPAAAPGPAPADAADAPNGQHHLLRHVLSPEQCSDALRHFGTADSKTAARMVNRMSQRELRDMFCKVRRRRGARARARGRRRPAGGTAALRVEGL